MTHLRLRDDRGFAGGIEALPFGLLVIVFGMLLIANAWSVVDASLATTNAAREGVRAYVESPSAAEAEDRAVRAVAETIVGYGRSPFSTSVDVSTADGRGWTRCALAIVTVRHQVPLLTIPVIGGFGHVFDVTSTQRERVDPYRDGVDGEARC